MKRKILSTLLALVLVLSLGLVAAAVAAEPGTLLSATGAIGTGNEDRIEVSVPSGTTLGDIESIAWSEYLLEGYPPHVDIIIDGDALVFEYAHNSDAHYAEGPMPYGALTDAWYQTFSDDGAGPPEVTDSAFGWLSSGAAGPYPPVEGGAFIGGTLAEWKAGTVDASVDASTPVLRLEIEIDNWVLDCEALVDGIIVVLTGETIDLSATVLSVPDIVAISVTPTSIDFGDLAPGETSAGVSITVSNVGTVPVDIVTSVGGTFFVDNLWLNEILATDYAAGIGVAQQVVPDATVEVPLGQPAGTLTGTLTFEVTAP